MRPPPRERGQLPLSPGATHGAWGCAACTPSRGESSSRSQSGDQSRAPHIFRLCGGAAPGERGGPGLGRGRGPSASVPAAPPGALCSQPPRRAPGAMRPALRPARMGQPGPALSPTRLGPGPAPRAPPPPRPWTHPLHRLPPLPPGTRPLPGCTPRPGPSPSPHPPTLSTLTLAPHPPGTRTLPGLSSPHPPYPSTHGPSVDRPRPCPGHAAARRPPTPTMQGPLVPSPTTTILRPRPGDLLSAGSLRSGVIWRS